MTIKIEREAVLTALGASHTSLPSSSYRSTTALPTHQHEASYSPSKSLELIEPSLLSNWHSEAPHHLRSVQCCMVEDDSIPELEDTDDDCTTISSCSSDVRSRSERATVTFASVLVTEVRTRPRTRPEDVSALFYSCEETQRFRREYRDERNEVHDDETTPTELIPTQTVPLFNDNCGIGSKDETLSSGGHRISRVVVMHEDTLETFVDKDMAVHPAPISLGTGDITAASDDFFDNDRFWSGQITWY